MSDMEPPPAPNGISERRGSFGASDAGSETAADFISNQLQLESDAREALPYQFDSCTRPLGPLRQQVFSCLTCNPPPQSTSAADVQSYTPAGVCYSCSISCHGDHELVELFTRRNFVCDCGTTRLPASSPCTLRINEQTGQKGGVTSETPAQSNTYNQNFRNRFCGCSEWYDAHKERGIMFQCMGLKGEDEGGCGEDWWHPECITGIGRGWCEKEKQHREGADKASTSNAGLASTAGAETSIEQPEDSFPATSNTAQNGAGGLQGQQGETAAGNENDDLPLPPGFPSEDDFEYFICYKCVAAFPYIRRYAGAPGVLPGVPYLPSAYAHSQNGSTTAASTIATSLDSQSKASLVSSATDLTSPSISQEPSTSRKRKASDPTADTLASAETNPADPLTATPDLPDPKRLKPSEEPSEALNPDPILTTNGPTQSPSPSKPCTAPSAPTPSQLQVPVSLFLHDDFRLHLCHCTMCFPILSPHPPLLEEEEAYEPPYSTSSNEPNDNRDSGSQDNRSQGSRSLLDRGEAALNTMDRVRAIEGVMAYNHVRDKVKAFLAPFAASGEAVSAEDVKRYFEKLRGDEAAIREAEEGAKGGDGGSAGSGDGRREQGGY